MLIYISFFYIIVVFQHLYFNNKTSSAHSSSVNALESLSDSFRTVFLYCAFQKHRNSEVLKPPLHLRFSLLKSIIIIIMITSNKPQNTEAHKTDRNAPIKNHKQWPFEPIEVNYFSLNTQTSVRFCSSPRMTGNDWNAFFFPLDMYVEKFVLQQIWVKYSWVQIVFENFALILFTYVHVNLTFGKFTLILCNVNFLCFVNVHR